MKEISATVPQHLMLDDKAPPTKAKNSLGKDDFMKLLMTQLTHQDPMKPMDHEQFSAQLAQFGSLEQLQNIGKGIEGLKGGIGDGAKLSALTLIGKKVQTIGNEVQLVEGQSVSLKYQPKDGLTPIKASVYGENGSKLVREISIDARKEGAEIVWDGKDTEGKTLPAGNYTFRVQGTDKQGQSAEMGTELSGRVTGVDMEGADTVLLVQTPSGSTRVDMAKIRNVSVDDTSSVPAAVPATVPKVAANEKSDKLKVPIQKSIPSAVEENAEVVGAKEVEETGDEPDPFSERSASRTWNGVPSHFLSRLGD